MKILVTGATGFVGHSLCQRLIDDGHQVRILRRESSDTQMIKHLELETVLGDVTDINIAHKACEDCELVFHLAGVVGYSSEMRTSMKNVNVHGTQNIITACLKSKSAPKLIHLSSVVAVGASFSSNHILTEESPYNLRELDLGYFETKKEAETLVRNAVFNNKLKAIILNPSTIYGPGDSKKGSRNVQLKVARGKFPVYPPGGVNVVHIDDVLHCLLKSIDLNCYGERFIISGENLYIKDLFHLIAQEAGVTPPQIPLPKLLVHGVGQIGQCLEKFGKNGPLNRETAWVSTLFHWFDSSKAQRTFAFKPKSAQEAIKSSIDWSRQQDLL